MPHEPLIPERYSAAVRLALLAEGREYPLSHVGPDFVIFQGQVQHPPCDAQVVFSVNGDDDCWPVRLVQGARPTDEIVPALRRST